MVGFRAKYKPHLHLVMLSLKKAEDTLEQAKKDQTAAEYKTKRLARLHKSFITHVRGRLLLLP